MTWGGHLHTRKECLLTQTQADMECLITPGRVLGFRSRKDWLLSYSWCSLSTLGTAGKYLNTMILPYSIVKYAFVEIQGIGQINVLGHFYKLTVIFHHLICLVWNWYSTFSPALSSSSIWTLKVWGSEASFENALTVKLILNDLTQTHRQCIKELMSNKMEKEQCLEFAFQQ